MRYLADPIPVQTSTPYDDAELRAKLKVLVDNEAIDDKFAADLDAAIKAIKIPDLGSYAKKSEVVQSGDALPLDEKTGVLFVLKGHASLPNGVYFWDGLWVQV